MKYYNKLISFLILAFGLKGSWKWAVKQIKAGKIVTRKRVIGSLKYRLSTDQQNRLLWDFHRKESEADWQNANFFLSDMECTDWMIYNWKE